jgi:hypothetical protein
MTWPVAKPGYWVDGNDPSQVRACKESLGSCPGSMLYGVGSAAWMRRGDVGIAVKGAIGVPDEACLIEYGSAKPPLGCPIVRCHEGDETNKTLDEHTFHLIALHLMAQTPPVLTPTNIYHGTIASTRLST